MVYIHIEGGYSGSNGDWCCDGANTVKRSMENGKPNCDGFYQARNISFSELWRGDDVEKLPSYCSGI
jgi:hypothetical protein